MLTKASHLVLFVFFGGGSYNHTTGFTNPKKPINHLIIIAVFFFKAGNNYESFSLTELLMDGSNRNAN